MDYLDNGTHNTHQSAFNYLENGRSRILNFGYSIIVFRNGLKKSFAILRELLISSHDNRYTK